MEGVDVAAILESLSGLVTAWGLKVVGAVTVLIVGRIAAGWARGAVVRGLQRAKVDETLVPFLGGMAYALFLTFVVIAVLGLFGVPTASFVAVLGAAGLAVGLALQGTLSNFAAGVMLLMFRPFVTGDVVEVGGTRGKVASIGIFTTTMNTLDNVRVIVPNSSVFGTTIKNYSANDTRRVDLVVGVSYNDDLQVAADTIERVVRAHPSVLSDPEPTIAVNEMADSSVNFVVRPWSGKDDYWMVYFDLTRQLKEALEESGCQIPFPQRDVHLHQAAS